MFSILVPSLQLATNVPLPPSHIQQPVPRLLNNIREHCRVCNLPYEPNRGLTSSNQHTQWCHHFCPHLGTSCGALLLLQVAPRPELLVTYPWTASRAQAAATSSSEPETCELHANLQFEEDMYIYIYRTAHSHSLFFNMLWRGCLKCARVDLTIQSFYTWTLWSI